MSKQSSPSGTCGTGLCWERIGAVGVALSLAFGAVAGCGDAGSSTGGDGTGGSGGAPIVPVDVAVLAVTEPGEPLGPASEALVPVTGGTVESADGVLTIDIPDGALAAPTTITIQPVTNGCPGALGVAYKLGPEGQTFDAPVKLTFHYTDDDLAGTEALALRVAYHTPEGTWASLNSVVLDEAAKKVSAETLHFSEWSRVAGWKLSPSVASTPPSKFVALQVKVCSSPDVGPDLTHLLYTCAPDDDLFIVQEWAVNGIASGNASVGTVAGSEVKGTAQYLAPSTAPASNPVAVSAAITDQQGRKTQLVSNIWVDPYPPLEGWIASWGVNTMDSGDIRAASATVRFVWSADQSQYVVDNGTFFASHDQKNPGGATCEIHTTLDGTLGPMDGAILIQAGSYYPYGLTSGMFVGTTSCTSDGAVEPLTISDSANWWPTDQLKPNSVRDDGVFEGDLTGVLANGYKTNVMWNLVPSE